MQLSESDKQIQTLVYKLYKYLNTSSVLYLDDHYSNITVSHWSLTDQLVFMTDHNYSLIGHTCMTVQGIIIVIAWMVLVGNQ